MGGGALFRAQALEGGGRKALGEIVLARPVSFFFLTLAAVGAAGLFAAFAYFGAYTRKATVAGVILPRNGLIKVYSPQAGVVLERRVAEGQRVKEGEVLYVLSSERHSAQGATQATIGEQVRARRASLREELAKRQALQRELALATAKRLADMRSELAQREGEIATQERRTQLAEVGLGRFRSLHATRYISEAQLQQKNEELLEQQSRLQALARARTTLLRDINALAFELASLPLRAQNELAVTRRSIAEVEQELAESEARRVAIVAAPSDGTATAVLAEPGQLISPQQALVSVVPGGDPLEAQLYAPSRAVGFVQPGSRVVLRYQAYPYQKFGHHEGVVKYVSRSALQPSELPFPAAGGELQYRITVALSSQEVMAYGAPQRLQAGMVVEADVLLDRRRIYEWALEPLYSITGRL